MRNKLFQQALDGVPEETRQKIRDYTDMIDEFEKWKIKNNVTPPTPSTPGYHMPGEFRYYTSEELYQKFLEEFK